MSIAVPDPEKGSRLGQSLCVFAVQGTSQQYLQWTVGTCVPLWYWNFHQVFCTMDQYSFLLIESARY